MKASTTPQQKPEISHFVACFIVSGPNQTEPNQTKKQEDYHMSAKCDFLFNKFTIKVCVWRPTPNSNTRMQHTSNDAISSLQSSTVGFHLVWWTGPVNSAIKTWINNVEKVGGNLTESLWEQKESLDTRKHLN